MSQQSLSEEELQTLRKQAKTLEADGFRIGVGHNKDFDQTCLYIASDWEAETQFRIGKLCDRLASQEVTKQQRSDLTDDLTALLGDTLQKPLNLMNPADSTSLLIKAIEQKYPDADDPLEAFLQDIRPHIEGYCQPDTYSPSADFSPIVHFMKEHDIHAVTTGHGFLEVPLTPEQHTSLMQGLKEIDDLHLQISTPSVGMVEAVSGMKNLTNLQLNAIADNLQDQHLAGIATCPNIEHLAITSQIEFGGDNPSKITDEGLKHFAGLQHLKSLNLAHNSRITGTGLVHVADKPIESLSLWDTGMTADCIDTIARMTQLKDLNMGYNHLTLGDCDLSPLQQLPHLESLREFSLERLPNPNPKLRKIAGFINKPEDLDKFADLPLEEITIIGGIGDEPLWSQVSTLRNVINGSGVSNDDRRAIIEQLQVAHPHASIDKDFFTQHNDKTVAFIREHHPDSNDPIQDFLDSFQGGLGADHPLKHHKGMLASLQEVVDKLAEKHSTITSLRLNAAIPDEFDLAEFAKFPNLRRLDFSAPPDRDISEQRSNQMIQLIQDRTWPNIDSINISGSDGPEAMKVEGAAKDFTASRDGKPPTELDPSSAQVQSRGPDDKTPKRSSNE